MNSLSARRKEVFRLLILKRLLEPSHPATFEQRDDPSI